MKKTWDGEAVKDLYRTDVDLQGEWIDFTPWVKEVYGESSNVGYTPLKVDVSDKRIHQEIVTGLLYAILVKRYKWQSIKAYYYPCVYAWISYIRTQPVPIYLENLSKELANAFIQSAPNPTQAKKWQAFIKNMQEYLSVFLIDSPLMDRDIWCLEYFKLSVRRHGAGAINVIRFDDINNERNRWLLKQYARDLLEHSDLAVSTILGRLYTLKNFLRRWGNRPLESFTQQDLNTYAELLDNTRCESTRNAKIYALRDFFSKATRFGMRLAKPVIFEMARKKVHYRMRGNMISEHVIKELFSRLDKLPLVVSSLLLVIYYSGIRISEAVHMRVDAMHKLPAQEMSYIQVYQFKMRKYVVAPIPNHLYELLLKQRDYVLRKDPREQYLFPARPGMPFTTSFLGQYMNRFCRTENICDEKGEPFYFRLHEFRHNYAMRLIRNDVPFLTVQHLLHHDSPEMTLAYVRLDEETRKQRYMQFCEKNEARRKLMSPEEKAIDDNMIWLHHQISQVLPNGYCGYPTKLGACPHANACLFCDQFSTSKEFLPVLRYQLAKIRNLQRYRREGDMGAFRQVEQRLLEIIQDVKGENNDTGITKSRIH